MLSPVKSMTMSGKIETNPYRLRCKSYMMIQKKSGLRSCLIWKRRLWMPKQAMTLVGTTLICSYIFLNKLKNQCLFLQFISDNPANVLHFVAKYVNASAVLAEVYREENSRRITESLFAMKLNTSRILHTRIHWKPTMISDLKVILDS